MQSKLFRIRNRFPYRGHAFLGALALEDPEIFWMDSKTKQQERGYLDFIVDSSSRGGRYDDS
jgi:hypothetical protein